MFAVPVPDYYTSIKPKTALAVVDRIIAAWNLRRQDIPALLGRKPRTVRGWYEETPTSLDDDVIERIGHLIGIYDALHLLFGDAAYANEWLHTPNTAFAGQKPATVLLSGRFTAVVDIHRYLQRGLG